MLSNSTGLFLLIFAALIFTPSVSAQEYTNERTIVALGDSNTAGFGVGKQEAFPSRLQRILRRRGQADQVVNAGVPGNTLGEMLARLDFSVPQGTKKVIVQGGYNDVAEGVPHDVSFANLDRILGHLQDRGIKAVVCGFFNRRFDAEGRRISARHGAQFVPGSTCYDPRYAGPDGLHMSAQGHAVVADRLASVLSTSGSHRAVRYTHRAAAQHARHRHHQVGMHSKKRSRRPS